MFRRCYGNFFTCHDQQPFRTDSLEMEEVVLRDMTDYYGYVAWGEYSHCFAAVLNQVGVKNSNHCFSLSLDSAVKICLSEAGLWWPIYPM